MHRIFKFLSVVLILVPSCTDSGSKADGTVDAEHSDALLDVGTFCDGICGRSKECDRSLDLQTCAQSCQNANAASVPKASGHNYIANLGSV